MSKPPPYILTNPNSGRHLYGRGWLGLIPLIGFFVGVGLLILGIIRYKDRRLIWIGIAAMFFTIVVYGSMYLYSISDNARKQWVWIVPDELNTIVKEVEFYKIQHGAYPDSLEQIRQDRVPTFIYDPVSAKGRQQLTKYNYQRIDNGYILYSSGIDKMPRTADDIFPTIDTTNLGLIQGWGKH